MALVAILRGDLLLLDLRGVAVGRPRALNGLVMNTLSKVLVVFCVVLSAVAFAKWEKPQEGEVGLAPSMATMFNTDHERAPSPVSVTTSADGKIVYYACSARLFKSTDGGETWAVLK